eukprot:Mrub_04066.p1 GENE.Mrub_04066~~Mrub_04066.p1  ORF type:complete len:431 (-),score=91.84 Mrub_04066:45-1277(-)
MKKKNFNEVRDSYNNDFKKENKNINETKEVYAKNNVNNYSGSNKYVKKTNKYNSSPTKQYETNYIDYSELINDYDRNKSILYDQKNKVFPNTVIERVKRFYDGSYDMSKDKHLPRMLDPIKDQIYKSINNDREHLNKIDLSYMKQKNDQNSYSNFKSTARTSNINNSKLTGSPTNLDRSLMDQSLLERINIDKSSYPVLKDDHNKSYISNDHSNYNTNTQLVTLREGNLQEAIPENDELGRQFSDDTFVSQYFNNEDDEYNHILNNDAHEGIDIGLFKGKMPMDYETLTKVCQLINHFSKTNGQIDNIKKRNDRLYDNFNQIDKNDKNVGSNRIAIKMKYKKEQSESQQVSKPEKSKTYYEKLDKIERMKMYTNQNKYLNKLSNTTRKFKGFVIEKLNEDGFEDYEYHLY